MIDLLNSLNTLQPAPLALWDAAAGAEAVAEEVGQVAEGVSATLFSVEGLFTLGMLVLLQAVLGFDNLLYISIESKRVPPDQQAKVRRLGIGLAIAFRIVLLFVLINLIELVRDPFFHIDTQFISAAISGHSLIVLGGGAFIIWTAVKEIFHMLAIHDIEHTGSDHSKSSFAKVVTMIVLMNLVFSFDSILSAMALTSDFATMATAIVISGLMMMWLADRVAAFLQRNRLYEVLGLFILFIVGIMLVSEGGHLAELALFGYHVMPMTKATFYFVLVILILVDVVQSRYQRKLLAQQKQVESKSP